VPWHRSGRVARDAFALARAADGVGVVTGPARRVLFVAVFLLPFLAASALLAAVAGRRRVCGGCAVASSIVGIAGATVVLRLHGTPPPGPWVAWLLALLALASGSRLIFWREAT
jgi:hypothetical protein